MLVCPENIRITPSLYSSPYSDNDSDKFLSKRKNPTARASPDRSSNLSANNFKNEGKVYYMINT